MGEGQERHYRRQRTGRNQNPRECIEPEGEAAEQTGSEKHDDGEDLQEQGKPNPAAIVHAPTLVDVDDRLAVRWTRRNGSCLYSEPVISVVANLVRGALIGVAEVIPGVSGGTIALIVGIYRTVIDAIADAVLALRQLLGLAGGRPSGSACARTLRGLPWRLLIPVGIGMVAAVVVGARFIEPLLEEYPVQMRALFFGLVLAGIWVPAHMVRTRGGWSVKYVAFTLIAAIIVFVITGLPPAVVDDPSPVVVALAAAVAICALVLPGVSGSFLLLSLGLYEPTLQAVNERDLVYLGAFAVGAIVGLGSFVTLLTWLLNHRAAVTLAVLTGLMIGSLRALWPWQTDDRDLLAPTQAVGSAVVAILIGMAVVAVLLVVERRLGLSEEQESSHVEPS